MSGKTKGVCRVSLVLLSHPWAQEATSEEPSQMRGRLFFVEREVSYPLPFGAIIGLSYVRLMPLFVYRWRYRAPLFP